MACMVVAAVAVAVVVLLVVVEILIFTNMLYNIFLKGQRSIL